MIHSRTQIQIQAEMEVKMELQVGTRLTETNHCGFSQIEFCFDFDIYSENIELAVHSTHGCTNP